MEININGIELDKKEIDFNEEMTLNEILQKIQNYAANLDETIVSVSIDDIVHNLDFYDEENDMDSEFIDKIDIVSEPLTNVAENVLIDIESYLNKIYENIGNVCDLFEKENKIEAVNKLYDILEGLKYVNIAFNSLNNMNIVNVKIDKIEGSTFVEALAKLNNIFLDIVDNLKEQKFDEIINTLEYEVTITLRECLDFFPILFNQITKKGE